MSVRLNEDKEIVAKIREGLKRKGGHCPCKLEVSPATKCICQEFRDQIADPNTRDSATVCSTINPRTEKTPA